MESTLPTLSATTKVQQINVLCKEFPRILCCLRGVSSLSPLVVRDTGENKFAYVKILSYICSILILKQ